MDNQADSESYWNRSASKAFSFDDDEDEGFNLNTTDGISAAILSGPFTKKRGSLGILNDDTISEASFDNSSGLVSALNLSIKSVISEEALNIILEEQTLNEKILAKSVPPEEELKLLRKQIQTTLYSPSSEITALKLLNGKQCSLEVFRPLHEKEQLLDAVLANGGGDAIIGVLLFLKKTLKNSKFHEIIKRRPRALQHYISYLIQRLESSSEVTELKQLFRTAHETALYEFDTLYRNANENCKPSDILVRKQKLCELIKNYSATPSVIGVYQQLFQTQLKIMELAINERTALDNLVQADSTPAEVLFACLRKNTNWQERDLQKIISPFRLCVDLQISAPQFEWTALNERASTQAYADLEFIFIKQKQFHVSFSLETAIMRLLELQAPASIIYIFISKINNATTKLAIAKKVKCFKGIIDALVTLKDITQLAQLRDSFPKQTVEYYHCENALKSVQTKRWSTDGIRIKL